MSVGLEPRSGLASWALMALPNLDSSTTLWKTYLSWVNLANAFRRLGGRPGNLPPPVTRRTQFRLLVALTIVWAIWAGWSLLGRSSPYTLRVVDDVGAVVVAANVDIGGDQAGATDSEGHLTLRWSSSSDVLEVSAPGHITQMVTVADRPENVFDVVLKARVLRGRVLDKQGNPVGHARISSGPAVGVSDEDGRFDLRGAEPGTVEVSRPAWVATSFSWDGSPGDTVVELIPFDARAVHIRGEAVVDDLEAFIAMAHDTELNALMIDLKNEAGLVWYNSANQVALDAGSVQAAFDLAAIAERAEEEELYLIGRLVLFNDPVVALAKPSMAVWDTATEAPLETDGQRFLDPTDSDARAFALDLAREVCEMGVDEVQLDYVRFPDNRPESSQFDGGSPTPEVRTEAIESFLIEAAEMLRPMGCALAADVFGFITAPSDLFPDAGIGQNWERVSGLVDVISPMVYPSHYDANAYGFENPNDHPGQVVRRALRDGVDRLNANVIVRPWLQDFGYSAEQVRAQIDVAESYGFGWMLWNARSDVTVGALNTR